MTQIVQCTLGGVWERFALKTYNMENVCCFFFLFFLTVRALEKTRGSKFSIS